jgi:hypothetical protein
LIGQKTPNTREIKDKPKQIKAKPSQEDKTKQNKTKPTNHARQDETS